MRTFLFEGRIIRLLCLSAIPALATIANAQEDFNAYINKSVEKLLHERADRGFGDDEKLSSAYSQDLEYADTRDERGSPGVIKYKEYPRLPKGAKRPATNPTICVAAVAETIIEALNLYYKDDSAKETITMRRQSLMKLPPRKWSRMPVLYPKSGDISGYLFTLSWCNCKGRYEFKRRGWGECKEPLKNASDYEAKWALWDKSRVKLAENTGQALEKFGIGEVIKFDAKDIEKLVLKPGDLINHNRKKCKGLKKKTAALCEITHKNEGRIGWGGHAVVFRNWILSKDGRRIGYEYFSAQTFTNGFGNMKAYFRVNNVAQHCPPEASGGEFGGKHDDCGVERNFDVGRMWHPRNWKFDEKMVQLKDWLKERNLYACGAPWTSFAPEFDNGDNGIGLRSDTDSTQGVPAFQNLLIDGR